MTMSRWMTLLDGCDVPGRDSIGGKAWSLARMAALGLPVPPAFVIRTEACKAWFDAGKRWPEGLEQEIAAGIAWLEHETGRRFGGSKQPLLVSVRSGAAVSMPGMMDTVLDLGMNTLTEQALAAESGDAAFARDTHRRFCELYGRIVLRASTSEQARTPAEIRAAVLAELGIEIPQAPVEQLLRAVAAVFESSRSRRAKAYRKHHGMADDLPTAVTVQAMVFGNLDARSGTGVLFTRNPLSGEPLPYGEYLARAQGEDVVAGTAKPEPLEVLRAQMPEAHAQLIAGALALEREERDMQDIEFTVERGRLWFLQTRAAKRSPAAAIRVAVEMAESGAISEAQALARISVAQVDAVLRPYLSETRCAQAEVLARGEPASPGVASGIVVGDADEAERRAALGEAIVLGRPTTSPDDVHGMIAATAVITDVGGSTSHAAVVGRQLGKPCVVGCGDGTLSRLVGREVTVDGERGLIYAGLLELEQPREQDHPWLSRLARWTNGRPLRETLATADN
jgi:pyruvate,orthophosphate dikinase